MHIKERLDSLSRGELVGLIVVVVLTLAGAGLWFQRSLPTPVQIAASGSPAPPFPAASVPVSPVSGSVSVPQGASAAAGAVSSSPAGELVVDVAGMVHRPGVYRFPPGDRVIDAVDRAGGALAHADLSLINLAAVLIDGQQIVVPKQGAGGAAGTVTAPGGASVVNINTADATALEALPGIGEVLAAAIVQYRAQHGPFTAIEQLQDVSGIGPATFADIKDQVTV